MTGWDSGWYYPSAWDGATGTRPQDTDTTFRLLLIAPSTDLAIPFATACQHLRLGDPAGPEALAQQVLVESLIRAASGAVERYCDMALLTQQWRLSCATLGPRFAMPKAPLQSVEAITVDGNPVDAGGYSVILDERLPGLVVAATGFPASATQPPRPDAVTINFTAGWPTADAIPPELVSAMLLMLGTWFMNRESAMPFTLQALPDIGVKEILGLFKQDIIA
jgi:uncharacterized phiE125 gp8 family phage protein